MLTQRDLVDRLSSQNVEALLSRPCHDDERDLGLKRRDAFECSVTLSISPTSTARSRGHTSSVSSGFSRIYYAYSGLSCQSAWRGGHRYI